jgi:RND family efflux transporter MFP subunit
VAAPDHLEDLRIDRSERPGESPWPRRALLLGLSVLIVGVAAWWLLAGFGAVEVETAKVIEVQSGGAGGGVSVLDASGYVVARREATVSSKITGRLEEVAIEEGMTVTNGEILARLDDANARRALDLAEAQRAAAASNLTEIEVRLRNARQDLQRVRNLADSGIESRSALDDARAEHDSRAAQLAAARDRVQVAAREVALREQELEDTLVRAPFDGVVTSKDAQPGEIVSPMSAGGGFTRTGIGTIVDMSSLEIEVDVNEAYIQRVRAAQPVVATLDAYPDWKIPAHVITTIPSADREKATVKVRIGFETLGDARLLPDMGVKVSFQAEADAGAAPRARLVVPERAVRRTGNTSVVFVVRDGTVERRAVSTGGTTADGIEVTAGLRAGDEVVVSPPADLADGAEVEVVEENA